KIPETEIPLVQGNEGCHRLTQGWIVSKSQIRQHLAIGWVDVQGTFGRRGGQIAGDRGCGNRPHAAVVTGKVHPKVDEAMALRKLEDRVQVIGMFSGD